MGIIRNESIRNSISFYIGMFFGAINTVIIYPNVFKDNPFHFGLIQIILAYAILISAFTGLGTPKTFLRFFSIIKDKGQLYFLSLLTTLLGFLVALLSYYLFKDKLFEILNASELLRVNFFYVILLVFFISFYEILTSISRSFLKASTPVFINEVFLKFYSMSVLFLHWFGYIDFKLFLQIYFFGYIIKFAILFIILFFNNHIFLNLSLKDLNLREIFIYGLYVLASGISIIIVTRIDMMMIASLLDLSQVAFYTVAFFIGNAIMVPAKSIAAISVPLIANAWKRNDLDEIQTIYTKSSINQLIIGGVFFLCIWLNIDNLLSLLPNEFQSGKWVVFYIGLSQLFNMATGLNGEIIINSRYYRYEFVASILLVFLTIITNYFLIPKFGINGAALATAISILVYNTFRVFLLKVKLNMHPFSIKTIYTMLLLIFIYYVLLFFPNDSLSFVNIIWRSLIVLLIFIPSVLLLKLSDDITSFLKDLKSNFLF